MHDTSCKECGKTDAQLSLLRWRWECSHVECPKRKQVPEVCEHRESLGDGGYRVKRTDPE